VTRVSRTGRGKKTTVSEAKKPKGKKTGKRTKK
jgi:hypothetical protein